MNNQFYTPPLTKVNKTMIIALVSLLVLSGLMGKIGGINLSSWFGLSAAGLASGKVWQVLTYGFLPHGLMDTIFNSLILWFIGSELEGLWGTKRYINFLATVLLGAGAVYLLLGMTILSGTVVYGLPLSGCSGLASALCVVYGVLNPERSMYFFLFPIKGKYFVMILVAMSLYQGVFSPFGVFAWIQLAAMGAAVLWMVFLTKRAQRQKAPRKRKRATHLQLIKDEDDETKPPTIH